jgi:hypothetical protein
VGAFVCYVIADILVLKIAGRIRPLLGRLRLPRLRAAAVEEESIP